MTSKASYVATAVRLASAAAGGLGLVLALGCSAQSGERAALAAPNPSLAASTSGPPTVSGQRVVGQGVVEPAINDANGNAVYLLTPSHVPGTPFPSISNPRSWAPMYLAVYPTTSTIDPSVLDCQPTNCDHVNVLPFPAPGYVNGGSTCTQYGFAAGGCALLLGHDHLIGVPPTGDFNVAWNVILVIFTPQAVTDGAINKRILTLSDIKALEASGDAFEAPSGITFNCSIVSQQVYLNGTPITL